MERTQVAVKTFHSIAFSKACSLEVNHKLLLTGSPQR